MTGKSSLSPINKAPVLSVAAIFSNSILPWIICGFAAAFYCYEYLLRIMPGQMLPELQSAFTIRGQFLDATSVTVLVAFYNYAYTPMQLPVGLLMDRYGPRWILTIAVICCAVGTALFGTTSSWWVAAFGRFLIGFGSAFAFVGVLKLASTWLPPNRFALVSGLTTTLAMVGGMLGGIILTDLIQKIGWQDTILYSSYVGFVLVPIIWLIVRDSPSHFKKIGDPQDLSTDSGNNVSYSQLWLDIKQAVRNKQIWINGMIGGLIMMPTMVFPELFGKLYLQTVHNFDEGLASRAVTMVFLGWAVGGPLAGFFSDWMLRRKAPLMVGSLLTTILLFVFLYYPALSVFQIKAILFLIGVVSSVEVICFAIGRENCSANLAGTAVAVTNFLVVAFAFTQILVSKILDLTWDGVLVEQTKVYSVHSFQLAMVIMPIGTLLAFFLTFFLKETYCSPVDSTKT